MSWPGRRTALTRRFHHLQIRPGRFTDGTFGLHDAGDSTEVAIAETIHHLTRTMRATAEPPGCTSQFRAVTGSVDARLDDASGRDDLLDPDSHTASQIFGADRRALGSNGIVWPSVRFAGGNCFAAIWPDVVSIPTIGAHFAYHWDGSDVDYVKKLDTTKIISVSYRAAP